MGMDIAALGVKIDPTAANAGAKEVQSSLKAIGTTAKTELGKLDAATDKVGASTRKMAGESVSAFGRMKSGIGDMVRQMVLFAGTAGIVTGSLFLFHQVIGKTQQFQQLNAQLETATGSAKNAATAFGELKKIAAQTPFDLAQVTTSFTKLVNYGLTPSKQALMSYGDTASSMGKSLDQMIEAVADATTGEFERLKEFGIKAKNEGDKITFTFRGVKESVANNAGAIEGYLIKLGEKNFGGGMARQMKTLGGAMSNFEDTWSVMMATIGEKGLGDFVEQTVRQATDSMAEFTSYLESGGFAVAMNAMGERAQGQIPQWQALGASIYKVLSDGVILIGEFVSSAERGSGEWETYWKDVFTNWPANIKFMFDLGAIYMDGFVQKAHKAATDILDSFSSGKFGDFITDSLQNILLAGGNDEVKKATIESQQRRRDARLLAESDKAEAAALAAGYSPLAGGLPADLSIDEQITANIDALMRETDALKTNTAEHNARAQALLDGQPGGPNFVGPPNENGYGVLPDLGSIPDPSGGDPLAAFKVGGSASSATAPKVLKAGKVKQELAEVIPVAKEVHSAMADLITQWGDLGAQADQTFAGIADSIAYNVTDAFTGLINGTKSAKEAFADMASSIINDILQMIVQMTIQLALSKALGGLTGTFQGISVSGSAGPIAHTGGTVGTTNFSTIQLPKFHQGGQLSSEQVVKADRGETILTRRRSKDLEMELNAARGERQKSAGSGGQSTTIINVLDRREISDAIAKSPGAVVNAMSRNLPAVRRMINSGQRA